MTPTLQQIQQMSMEASVATTKLGKLSNNYGKLLPDLKKINYYQRLQKDLQSTVHKVEKQALPDLKKLVKTNSETIKATKKIAEQGKKLADLFKKGLFKEINPKFGAWMNIGTTLLSLGFTTLLIKKNEEIQEIELRTADVRDAEFDKLWQRSLRNSSQVKNLTTKVNTIEKDYKTSTDKIYAEAAGAAKNAAVAREKANDALYEVRANKPKLEAQIAEAKKQSNDALYETRQGRVKLETQIAEAKKQGNDALYETRQGRVKLETQIAEAKKQGNDALYETRQGRVKLETELLTLEKEVRQFTVQTQTEFERKLQATVSNVNKELANIKSSTASTNKEEQRIGFLEKTITAAQQAIKTLESKLTTVPTSAQVEQQIHKQVDPVISKVVFEHNQIKVTIDGVTRSIPTLASGIQAVGDYTKIIDGKVEFLQRTINSPSPSSDISNVKIEQVKTDLNTTKKDLEAVKTELDTAKADLRTTNNDVKKLDLKIQQQERVNQQAIPKLDQLIGLLPLIPARTADAIRPSIPTIPQIETASATGTCRTLQPGGCSRRALDDLGNGINQNTNNQSNNLLDKLNAGANAAQLALLKIIDNKLGTQLPGGLSATFGRLWQMLQVDRILAVLTYITVVHNALMLSNNIFQTLFSAINNISEFAGFKWKNEKGDEVGFGGLVNEWIGNALNSIFGEQTVKNVNKLWNAANRIYQGCANIISAIQSIQQSILTALEVVGAGVARLANGLKAAGQVFEKAYEWMNPNPNFDNALFRTLGKLQDTASNIETVSQTPLDIKSSVESMKEEKKQMGEALKDGENALKGLGIIESENQIKKADKRKEVSAGKDLENVDKVEADD
jgi:hypothetical protein